MAEPTQKPLQDMTEEELKALAEKQYDEYMAKMSQHLDQLGFAGDMMKSLEAMEMMAALEPDDEEEGEEEK